MRAKPSPSPGKPLEVKRGNVTVKVYSGSNRVGETVYPQFTVVYYDGATRKKKRFADLEEAKREAELVATKLANGENEALRLTSTDRTIYVQAVELLRPLEIPLNLAVMEYVSAVRNLPTGATLKEAVDFFKRRNPATLEKRTVQQVVEEMLSAKRSAKLSEVHLKDLESRLNRFAGDFQMNISGISTSMLQQWLDALPVSGRTKQNYIRIIQSLFRFAIGRRYLPKDALEEVEAVQKPKSANDEIEILTPAEMRELLSACRPEMIPWIAIAGFAGLRSAEIQRLDWSEINLPKRYIEIKANKAKTATGGWHR